MAGRVVSVNVGSVRVVEWAGRAVATGIWKEPVRGPVTVAGTNLHGDDQADRRVHGGSEKAVYAYAVEDYAWWESQLGAPLLPATFGENLTTEGVDLAACVVGEVWEIGTALLRVTQPRFPCFKLGVRMGDAGFVDRFAVARRNGAYFAIERAGVVEAGAPAVLTTRPDDTFTLADFVAAHEDSDPVLLERLARNPFVPQRWRDDARHRLDRSARRG